MQQPLSEMSHTQRGFFGFIALLSFGDDRTPTDKKCYNYIERGHLTRQCPLAMNYHRNPTLDESSKMMLEDKSTK
jgi:hypothetical protein